VYGSAFGLNAAGFPSNATTRHRGAITPSIFLLDSMVQAKSIAWKGIFAAPSRAEKRHCFQNMDDAPRQ
jgi:hypothetical protein